MGRSRSASPAPRRQEPAPQQLVQRPASRGPSPGTQRPAAQLITITNAQGQKVQVMATLDYSTTVVAKKKVVVHAAIVIDASASMGARDGKSSDTRMESVLLYVELLVKDVLAPDDRITLAFFHIKYHQMYHNTKASKVLKEFADVRAAAATMMTTGGGTALYDNTLKAIESMGRTESGNTDAAGNPVMRNLIVFSDGEDNRSTTPLAELVLKLSKPGFGHFSHQAIIVGAPASAAQMALALKAVTHAQVISEADCTAGSIGKAFGKANTAMRVAKQLVEKLTLTVVQDGPGAQPCMPAVLQQKAAQMAPKPPRAVKKLEGQLAGMKVK